LAAAFKLNSAVDPEFELAARPSEAAIAPAPVIHPANLGEALNLAEPASPSHIGRKIFAFFFATVFLGICVAAAIRPDVRQKITKYFQSLNAPTETARPSATPPTAPKSDSLTDEAPSGQPAPAVAPPAVPAATQTVADQKSPSSVPPTDVSPTTKPAVAPSDVPVNNNVVKADVQAPPAAPVPEPVATPAMKAQAKAMFTKVVEAEVRGDYATAADLLSKIEKLPHAAWPPEDIEWRRQLDAQTAKNAGSHAK
jgi:hypothetical protein